MGYYASGGVVDTAPTDPTNGQQFICTARDAQGNCTNWEAPPAQQGPPVDTNNPVTVYTVDGSPSMPLPDVTVMPVVAPIASFSSQYLGSNAFQFADTSLNNPFSVHYDFGDGLSSNQPDPVHFYPGPGNYTVTETVRNAAGSSSVTITVTVPVVTVDFTFAVTGFFTVTFINISSISGPVLIDFGDGTSSIEYVGKFTHVYPNNNTFNVSMTIDGITVTHAVVVDTSVMLTWTDNSGGTASFTLEYSLDGINWNQFATVSPGITSYGVSQSVDGINTSALTSYRVCATNSGGNSAFTNVVSIKCGG
jgi:PKD repeat protein